MSILQDEWIGSFVSTLLFASSFFVGFLAIVGSAWFVITTIELIPHKWRHWLFFPMVISVLIGIPFLMFTSGMLEYISFIDSNLHTSIPIVLLMIGSMICNMGATILLVIDRIYHIIQWLTKSFDQKNMPNSYTRMTKYAINMIYTSIGFTFVSSVGIALSDIIVSETFFVNYTFLNIVGVISTYFFSKKVRSPVEMLGMPTLAGNSSYFAIVLWGTSKICSIFGCLLFSLGLLTLYNLFTLENEFYIFFILSFDIFLLISGLILLKLGDNQGKLRRLRIGLEKMNVLHKDFIPDTEPQLLKNFDENSVDLESTPPSKHDFLSKNVD